MSKLLTEIVRAVPTLQLVAAAATAGDALAQFTQHQPDVVILDLVLRTGSGLVVLREIKRQAPACRVLIFTSHDEAPFRARCLAEKADAFLSKNRQHQELIQLLHTLGTKEKADSNHRTGSQFDFTRSPARP